jgi:hypothetical protein
LKLADATGFSRHKDVRTAGKYDDWQDLGREVTLVAGSTKL